MCAQTVIEVDLIAGRYHAHLWGVSQYGIGEPEWPPSPWRLLRALASAWFNSDPKPCSAEERNKLFEMLGRCGQPTIIVPRTAFRELKFFQPTLKDGKPNQRVDHRDCFSLPEGGRFWFVFRAALSGEQRRVLSSLLARIRYLGRSESRTALKLCDRSPNSQTNTLPLFMAMPVSSSDSPQQATCHVREVLCPGVSGDNGTIEFRASNLWLLDGGGADDADRYFPEHLTDACLRVKRPLPDGCEWVDYAVPAEAIVPELPSSQVSRNAPEAVSVAQIWFRLSRRIPIPIGDTVRVARAFRDAAVANHQHLAQGLHSTVLTGCSVDQVPERNDMHCYYLPQPELERRKWLERLVVHVPAGSLSEAEFNALLSVSRIWRHDAYPISVVVERQDKPSANKSSRKWRSVTPFVTPLSFSRTGACPEQCLTASLAHAGFPAPSKLVSKPRRSAVAVHEYARNVACDTVFKFGRRLGYWMEFALDQDVSLPYAIGKDAHFGLGQFEPVD